MKKKELILFTMRFPYGRSEPFLENELPYLCERFSKVLLVPMFKDEGLRQVPQNAELHDVLADPYDSAGLWTLLRNWSSWSSLMRSVKRHAPSNTIHKRQKALIRARARQSFARAGILKNGLLSDFDPGTQVLYSYWNYDWALALSILRQKDETISFVTRMLGFDMFKERAPDNWPPFRDFQLHHAQRNFIISEAGMKHMKEHYPAYSDQYELSYLATHDHGVAPWNPSETIRLVSCSNVVELKRVRLIAEALQGIGRSVHWTHFGDGPCMEEVKGICDKLPDTIQVDLKGSTPNREILDWYKVNEVDMFVHVSRTEGGVPVSLQEAASFGIPLLGTNAGGIPEIVNQETGFLLALDLKIESLRKAICDLHERINADRSIREKVRSYWSERFRAEKVYREFAERLHDT